VPYDAALQDLQNAIQEHLITLLVDPSSVVKRAVLHDVSSMCIFLGRQRTNDILLSHMITYLNDRDWHIRYAFFNAIVDVAACAGGRSLEEYILPLMIQALSGWQRPFLYLPPVTELNLDVEESVVARVLAALTSLCELGLFQKMRIWELMSANLGFLYHPNSWIRQGTSLIWVPRPCFTLSHIRCDGFYRLCGTAPSIEGCLGYPLSFSQTFSSIRCPQH